MSHDFRIVNKKGEIVTNNGKYCDINDYGGNIRVSGEELKRGRVVPCKLEEFRFNMTYNYTILLYKYFGDSIVWLYGKKLTECIEKLEEIIPKIKKDYINVYHKDVRGADPSKMVDNKFTGLSYDIPKKPPTIKQMEKQQPIYNDYWAVTPANVCKALQHILDVLYWIVENYPKKQYDTFTFTGD